jgi:hypothetical protein
MKAFSWLPSFAICLLFLLLSRLSSGQEVVVSEYFNADQRDEWVELMVVNDNTNLVGYTLRDNNSSQTSWQTEITFSNNNLWTNLRAGTIIVIWNRAVSSTLSSHPIDTNSSDGYIEVNTQLNNIFSGGSFGSSPSWNGSSFNIAAGGDLIQLRNSSSSHVHALGHRTTVGTDWTALPSPKLNHSNNAATGESIRVNPGANISDYNGSSSTTYTSKSSSLITFGLPNKANSDTISNHNFWLSLRSPLYPSPTLNSIIANTGFNQFTLSWNSCTDPNPSDQTVGYIILRNTSNSFNAPSDGTTYSNGMSIGSATVITHINSSQTTSFIDSTQLACGQTYYYKIYAYRYSSDQQNGNTYHAARGRAYNETGTNVQSIFRSEPSPISSIIAY